MVIIYTDGEPVEDRVGIVPIILAAIPLVIAGVGAGIAATTPGMGGGQPRGAIRTVWTSNVAEEIPPTEGPSAEEINAYWAARGADGPWVDVLGVSTPPPAWSQRTNALQRVTAYLAAYGFPLYGRAADVPSDLRALWSRAQAAGQSLAQAAGVATPSSPVPLNTAAAGLLAYGFRAAPETWAQRDAASAQADTALAAVGAIGGALASAYGGPAAGAAVQAGVGALRAAVAAPNAGAAMPGVLAGLAQAGLQAAQAAQAAQPGQGSTSPQAIAQALAQALQGMRT